MTILSVLHKFVSAKGDGPDTTRVKPTNWNAEHDLVVDGDGVVLGRPAGAGPGPVVPVETSSLMPAGVIVDFAGTVAPPGWLMCYGQLLSRAAEPALFAAIGVQYGAGDGSTTFRAPDARGLVSAGKTDMGGADRGNLAGGGVLGAVLGGQYNFAQTPVSGGISGTAVGTLTLNLMTDAPANGIGSSGSGGGSTFNFSDNSHQHAYHINTGITLAVTGSFAGGSFNSGNFSVVQGTIVFNKIIKR